MKNLKKAVGLAIMLAFPLLAITAITVQGEGNRQDGENASEKGLEMREPLKAENVKIYKKKALSAKERAHANYVESQMKARPGTPPGKDKTKPGKDENVIATGLLGDLLLPGAKKYAIVIGLANYAGTANDLCVEDSKTPYSNDSLENTSLQNLCMDEDSLNMNGVLTGDYYQTGDFDYHYGYNNSDFEGFDRVHLFSDSDATYDAIIGAVNDVVGDAGPNDEIVFFFSGHGATSIESVDGDDETVDEAIVIYDQDYDEEAFVNNTGEYADNYIPGGSAYIWDGQLKALFAGAQTDRILFVFDTCKAGGMDDLLEGYEENNSDRILVASSTEWQYSYTYYLGGYGGYQESEGLFTHYFVKRAIRDERADGYNALKKRDPNKEDGNIAIEEAFQYAKPIVLKATTNYQKPIMKDLFENDLLLGYYSL